MQHNLILNADSYKASHYLQYPPGTTRVSSYIESRGGEYEETLFFGLQFFLRDYLSKPVQAEDIEEAEAFFSTHGLPFNKAGWEHILDRHGGYLPLEVQAVAEGSVVPVHNVLVQAVNTDPACPWLTSYVETALLRAVWYPVTVATRSWHCKRIIARYLEETADSADGLPFKLHDFGGRGASSWETACIGGAAHLVNFQGSDTVSGVVAANRYYAEPMAAFSIPAAEHSTITCWGPGGECDAFANMLEKFSGEGRLVAVVSDSYDLWNAIDNYWGRELRDRVRDSGGTLVVRPDSGNPAEVVCEALERLMKHFGHRVNDKGYRVLPDCLRLIQGDGVSLDAIGAILARMKDRGLSADNVAFGMGGELLQKVNRDTLKFAMKASAAEIDGTWRDVYKDPVTDHGKRSKAGRLALVTDPRDGFRTVPEREAGDANQLVTVFRDGEVLREWSLAEVRERSAAAL